MTGRKRPAEVGKIVAAGPFGRTEAGPTWHRAGHDVGSPLAFPAGEILSLRDQRTGLARSSSAW